MMEPRPDGFREAKYIYFQVRKSPNFHVFDVFSLCNENTKGALASSDCDRSLT